MRTKRIDRIRGWQDVKRFSIIAMVLMAVVAAGCTPTPPTDGTGPGTTQVTTQSVTPTTTIASEATNTPSTTAVTVRVYFSRNEKMQPVLRTLPAGTKATLSAAITALLAGPDAAESAAGLSSQIPSGTTLLGLVISGKTATVDLSSQYESGGGSLSMTNRLAQVVYTATQFPTVANVKFKLNGKPVKIFSGEGIMIDKPQTRADYEYSTAAIFVDNPAWQGHIVKGLTAGGTANVFEAVFRLQLRDSAGTLILDTTVKATSGTGTRGTWSQPLTWSDAKAGVGELKVFAESPKDGKPIDVVTIPVVIAP